MKFVFGIEEFTSYIELLIGSVFVLAGFMLAAFSLGFRREVSGQLEDGSVQKAFNYRNASRKLLRQFLTYAGVLVVLRLVCAPLAISADVRRWPGYILLVLSVALTLPTLWLLRETYRFYFNSTAMNGTGVV